MVNHDSITNWMEELRSAWEAKDVDRAVGLFSRTEYYYERPFRPGTSHEEIHSYWRDIAGLSDIRLEYDVVAVEGNIACVHWENWFRTSGESREFHLDGVFVIEFDEDMHCRVFKQWWFQED